MYMLLLYIWIIQKISLLSALCSFHFYISIFRIEIIPTFIFLKPFRLYHALQTCLYKKLAQELIYSKRSPLEDACPLMSGAVTRREFSVHYVWNGARARLRWNKLAPVRTSIEKIPFSPFKQTFYFLYLKQL